MPAFVSVTVFQITQTDAKRLAELVARIEGQCLELFDVIQEIKIGYKDAPAFKLKKLRQNFFAELKCQNACEKLRRRFADYWRCIEFAIINDVQRKHFCATNWQRMENRMKQDISSEYSSSSESLESDSSTFEEVLQTCDLEPLGVSYNVTFPIDQMDDPQIGAEVAAVESVKLQKPSRRRPRKKSRKSKKSKKPKESNPKPIAAPVVGDGIPYPTSSDNPDLESATQESISTFAEAYAKCMWLEWTKLEEVRFWCALKFELLTFISDLSRS